MKKLLLGNAAIARGAYEAGVRVVASYPGTPSTEITEEVAKFKEIYSEWSPNEKVAAEVAIGAAIGGARAMSCMKHVGLNVMADPVFTVSYTGIGAGLVFCVADDPGMHSSQNEQDSRHYAEAAKIAMLEPSDSQECKDFTKLAFEISEKYDTPVFVRLTTRVSHSQSLVELSEREERELLPYERNIAKYVMMPQNAIKRHVVVEERQAALVELAGCAPINSVEKNGANVGVITAGIAYTYAREALGNKVDYLKLGMVYPLSASLIADFAKNYDEVYVIEELDPFIESFCKANGISVKGKELFTNPGEILCEGFYGYEEKYSSGQVALAIRAHISDTQCEAIREYSRRLVRAMGVRDLCRVDFFLSSGEIYFNEINTMPGFTDGSLYAKMIEAYGISEGTLFGLLIDNCVGRG